MFFFVVFEKNDRNHPTFFLLLVSLGFLVFFGLGSLWKPPTETDRLFHEKPKNRRLHFSFSFFSHFSVVVHIKESSPAVLGLFRSLGLSALLVGAVSEALLYYHTWARM